VHAALSLVGSLFGVAVLFVVQEAHLLAAVQVIVYTGAIVVLILFVLMLLGVDKSEDIRSEPITAQRPLAILVGLLLFGGLTAVLLLPVVRTGTQRTVDANGRVVKTHASFNSVVLTGKQSATAPINSSTQGTAGQVAPDRNIRQIGRVLFTDYVFAFEVTALLLTIAVVGAVVLSQRVRDVQPLPETETTGEGAASDETGALV